MSLICLMAAINCLQHYSTAVDIMEVLWKTGSQLCLVLYRHFRKVSDKPHAPSLRIKGEGTFPSEARGQISLQKRKGTGGPKKCYIEVSLIPW